MSYRDFQVQSSLTQHSYRCQFVYLQTAISLRHSDTVDVKFRVDGTGVVVALPHIAWGQYQQGAGHALSDERAAHVAAGILKEALERGEAIELLDLNPSADEVAHRAQMQ
jgi:hypothetical protein